MVTPKNTEEVKLLKHKERMHSNTEVFSPVYHLQVCCYSQGGLGPFIASEKHNLSRLPVLCLKAYEAPLNIVSVAIVPKNKQS